MPEMTVREAANRLGLDPSRVRLFASTGALPARRVGRQWVVDETAVDHRMVLAAAGALVGWAGATSDLRAALR
jgi:excisionase family DNA binding protein